MITIITILLVVGTFCQVSPTWERNPNIDAGQVKPINFGVFPADSKTAGTIYDYNQRFNKTDFTVIPRVVIAQLGFGFFTDANNSQSSMGYNITMGTITLLNFTFEVSVRGVTIGGLHFIYIAVSPIYDQIYHMQNYYMSCKLYIYTVNSNDSIGFISTTSTRSQTIILTNPGGHITDSNFSSSQIVLQWWILSYYYTPSTALTLNLTTSIISTSQFQLIIQVDNSYILQELGITVIMVNKTTLLQYSYTQYIDIFVVYYTGADFSLDAGDITNFTTQYFYRNNLYGHTGHSVNLEDSFTSFYYSSTTNTSNIRTSYGLSQRSRVCPGSNPYYFYQNQTCISSCPQYYFTNTTFDFCISCHYSCLNCSAASNSQSCSQCDTTQNRQFINTSCPCIDKYFDNNTLLCVLCHTTCITCSSQLSTGCLSCNSTENRSLVNGSCSCIDGFSDTTSDNINFICVQCHYSCLTCNSELFNGCLSCNSSENRQLSSGQCPCANGFTQSGTICLQDQICGDGLLTAIQECDDGNTDNGDGCSSSCLIQTGHSCVNNASLSSFTICYYSNQLRLLLSYVYKVPLRNRIELTLSVSAPNANQSLLKTYLQTQTGIDFQSSSRLLAVSSIQTSQSTYQESSQTLSLNFDYSADLDLTSISLQINPSSSTNTNDKYFFDSPQTTISLASPNNLLLTTFLTDQQLTQQRTISWFFLVVYIFAWLFLIIGVIFNQTAVALQYLIVIQLAYQSLLQSQFIFQAWAGMVLFGKYTYGINASNVVETNPDSLTTLGINIPLANTLNITTGLLFLVTIVIVGIFLYQFISKRSSKQKDNESIAQAASVNIEIDPKQIQTGYKIKQRIVNYCLQIGLALSFLTIKISMTSLSLSIRESKSIISSILLALVVIFCSIILWIFFIASYNLQYLKDLSFRRLIRNTIYKQQNTYTNRLSNILVKYHYLIIFILLTLFGLINGLTSIRLVMFILLIIFTVLWSVLIIFNNHYYRKIHTIRSVINGINLIILMIVLLLQSLTIINPSQNLTPSIVGLTTLFITFTINIVVFVRVQYKRRMKQNKKKKHKTNKIINQNQIYTEQPIQLQQQQNNQKNIDQSHLDMYLNDKQSEEERDYNQQLTHKKMNKNKEDQLKTNIKKWNIERENHQMDNTINNQPRGDEEIGQIEATPQKKRKGKDQINGDFEEL